MLQPASAQRGVLFDVGVMERVMYASLVHTAHAGAASLGEHSHTSASGGAARPAETGPFPGAVARHQAVRPVSAPLACTPAHFGGGEEEGLGLVGGRTTRDWASRTLEIQTRYEDLAAPVTRKPGSGMVGAGPVRGRVGMLDLAELRELGGGAAPRKERSQSEGRPAGGDGVTGKVWHVTFWTLIAGGVGGCVFVTGRCLVRLAAVPCVFCTCLYDVTPVEAAGGRGAGRGSSVCGGWLDFGDG